MKKILFVIALFAGVSSYAQVGVGTSSPDESAQLDVVSANKGILIPRVKLTGSSDITSILNPKESLLVYNTVAAGDLIPGFYYWNKVKWVALGAGNSVGNISVANGGTGATNAADALLNLGAQSVINMTAVLGSATNLYPSENAVKIYVDNETARVENSRVSSATFLAAMQSVQNAQSVLESDLSQKASASDLNDEIIRAKNAESLLSTAVDLKGDKSDLASEVARATTAEVNLEGKIVTEEFRATREENALRADIASLATTTALDNEVNRAKDREDEIAGLVAVNQADILNEKNRAIAAEAVLDLSKENLSNKSAVITAQTDDVKYPSVKAVKAYVDGMPSFYTADGALSTSRTVTQGNNDLKFTTGTGKLIVDGIFRKEGAVYCKFENSTSASYTVPDNVNTIIYTGASTSVFTLPNAADHAGMEIKIYNVSGYDVSFPAGTFSPSTSQATLYTGTGAVLFCNGSFWYLLLGAA